MAAKVPQQRTVEVGEYTCYYTELGSQHSGTPIVILSSQLILARSYRWTQQELAKQYRVLSVELPGSGHSSHVERPWDNDTYSRWVVCLLKALALPPVCLVGHSDSGGPALGAAVLAPDRVSHLALVDSIGANAPDSLIRLFAMRGLDALAELRFTLPGAFHILFNACLHPRNFLSQLCVSAELDLTPQARQVTVPTLLAWGRRDRTIPVAAAARFFQALPHGHAYVCDAGSHNWLIQHPPEFAAALARFLTLPRGAPASVTLLGGLFQKASDATAANGSPAAAS